MIITGIVSNMPGNKVYLTDAYKWQINLDSSEYADGKFQFRLDTNKFKSPFFASIYSIDSNGVKKFLIIINYLRTNSKDTFGNSGFMLSYGETKIKGNFNSPNHKVNIEPNSEQDLLFNLATENIGAKKNIELFENLIRQNPSSYFLLNQMWIHKEKYSQKEIDKFLTLFTADVLKSDLSNEIQTYSKNIKLSGTPFNNLSFLNNEGKAAQIFDKSKSMTMLVFWASWCGPCRLEIPEIKKIYKKFNQQKIDIVSISIDENKDEWLQAVKMENCPWKQFLIGQDDMLKIKAHFAISAIPLVIFVNQDNKEIQRIVGFDEKNIDAYNSIINSYLSKKQL